MQDLLQVWSNSPGVSAAVWLAIIVVVLYLGRTPSHQLIRSTSHGLRASLRLVARSVGKMEERLNQSNKAVVLSIAREATERGVESEFFRINALVERDLSGYPALHRKISDVIERIESDFHNASEAPAAPPAWLDAVEAIANIPRNGDVTASRILDNIEKTIKSAHNETQQAYKKSSAERHRLLKQMLPSWRNLSTTIDQVKGTISGLEERSRFIDEQMQIYQRIRANEDSIARTLTSSSLTQFFIAGLVLLIAILGSVINFQLIALPMSEMVGGTSQLGPMRTADVAALVIIMVEMAMGLFLMESLRITHMFPIIGNMNDAMRKRMVIVTFVILAALATVEASLAYMRDLLALDREAIMQSLSGSQLVEAQFRWIPSVGQMMMGFILPFALAFVAIPLESFIHALRTALGVIAAVLLRLITFVIRLVGNVIYHTGKVFIAAYDLIIMLPLRVEQLTRTRHNPNKAVLNTRSRTEPGLNKETLS
ncbi:MAG: hypothetical protein GXP10_06630 [Gammaproteobacteria bacterium]|nr:hypothetical protein [Gammaproteobacteria bacterium]